MDFFDVDVWSTDGTTVMDVVVGSGRSRRRFRLELSPDAAERLSDDLFAGAWIARNWRTCAAGEGGRPEGSGAVQSPTASGYLST